MGEIKSVKVDNWGVFFLQKLQNFFNKTDYCDLTLQFHDNSQLKVHRLVLSACTDYFNVLEQMCEMVDDALIMPPELQADVIVPIVNFMYTGTLEFELKMYGKLLRTAKEMNMTVLLKLLEAHRRTMENVNRTQRPPSPKGVRRRVPNPSGASPTQRRIFTTSPQQQQEVRRAVQNKPTTSSMPYRTQIGSTSVHRTTVAKQDSSSSSPSKQQSQQPPSPFEQLRKGYNNTKRPATTTLTSVTAKKPNIEDVKEFAEQQRMRKQIAAEYGDDQEYEGTMDDDIMNSDDDDDVPLSASNNSAAQSSTAHEESQIDDDDEATTIIFKPEQGNKPPTIVVKDNSNSKMNHAKIISEVLRQYPHLVKSKKNIKLKILPNTSGHAQKIVIKKEDAASIIGASQLQKLQQQQLQQQEAKLSTTDGSGDIVATLKSAQPSSANVQKRRIDSKTMHALIALGAENTTGPWLCLRCGISGRPISIPTYRGFRRHLINTHKEKIDPALCEHCGWRSSSNRDLHFHAQVEHNVKTPLYTFPECMMCSDLFIDSSALQTHMLENHADENRQQCIYCNKIFAKEVQLFNHMKAYHKRQAQEDGIIDFSDTEDANLMERLLADDSSEQSQEEPKDEKVKILSDISIISTGSVMNLEPSSEAAALSTVASGIAASIGVSGNNPEEYMQLSSGETKFVNAEGNEVELTEAERKEIMSQLNPEQKGSNVVMVLNEQSYATETDHGEESQDAKTDDEKTAKVDDGGEDHDAPAEASTEEDEIDDSHIFKEFAPREDTDDGEAQRKSKAATTTNPLESKESLENLEWAEKLLSQHEMADENASKQQEKTSKAKSDPDDISKKLKELTGDWSEDENEDDVPAAAADDAAEEKQQLKTAETEKTAEDKDTKNLEAELKADLSLDVDDDKGAKHDIKPTEDDDKIEEDEIEKAMKNLHEEDHDEDMKDTAKIEETLKGNDITEASDENIKSEVESDVKPEEEKPNKVEDEDNEDEEKCSSKEPDDEIDEKTDKPLSAVASEKKEDDSRKEESFEKSELEEFLAEDDHNKELKEEESEESKNKSEDESKEIKKEKNDVKRKASSEGDFIGIPDDKSQSGEKSLSSPIAADVLSTTSSGTVTQTKTEKPEVVKSLISEWMDDGDGDGEEDDTIKD